MNILERTIISILSSGPIPGHVAFVMDGNRRFARGLNREVKEGHHEGYRTLKRVGTLFEDTQKFPFYSIYS